MIGKLEKECNCTSIALEFRIDKIVISRSLKALQRINTAIRKVGGGRPRKPMRDNRSIILISPPSLVIKTLAEPLPKPEEIGNLIERVVDFARQINSGVDSDNVQELLDSHYQKLAIDELIDIHE
ncbi:hypothetical protein TNCV_536531 [Trichonephila clavipes]|nr:hypothetical protein TNCV_536531 [Trichonephila clavipes]